MTPNDIQQELQGQLSNHGLPADAIGNDLGEHKRRRDAALDSATLTMSMRVQRAENKQRHTSARSRATQLALVMTAAAATVVMVTVIPEKGPTAPTADTVNTVTVVRQSSEPDVDVLADKLARRNGSAGSVWSVTDEDVDQLLGDADLDL